MEEIWKDVEGYEGLYQVSNLGSVRNTRTGKLLTLRLTDYGYLRAQLCCNGKKRYFFAHRLVAYAFIPNPTNLPYVNHKNEIKTDNRVENLEWCDSSYNNNYGTHNEKVYITKVKKGSQYDYRGLSVAEKDTIQKGLQKQYYQDNKDTIMKKQSEYRESNREYFKDYSKQYRLNHKDYFRDYMREYRKKKS